MFPKTAPPAQGFVYGRPAQPAEFVNRKGDLRTIFNRLRHGESTAVVGEPHIGKSSLLLKIIHPDTQAAYLGEDMQRVMMILLDMHPISSSYDPATFWQEALEPLRGRKEFQKAAQLLEQAAEAGYARRPLERLFNHLGESRQRLVLLLDEFDCLLSHPNFQDPSFFALLRSLATRTGGLAMVTASRLSVAKMNERGCGLLETGSPFFNNVIEIRLHPFDEISVGHLLGAAGEMFTPEDRRFIRRVAGRHPFLLQAMAAALAEAHGQAEDRYADAAEMFYEWISFHFDDLWRTLDDRTRTTAVILSLMELGGRSSGQRFSYGEIERVDAFGPELHKLQERGLADQVGEGWEFDWQHLLLWRGERWTVGGQAFVWWVRDVVISGSRELPAYEEWLSNKRYRLLLTHQQWERLVNTVRNAPEWAARSVGALARGLVEEMLRRDE